MHNVGFEQVSAALASLQIVRQIGRVTHIRQGMVEVSGLTKSAAQADLVQIHPRAGAPRMGEVLGLSGGDISVLPDGDCAGLQIGDEVVLLGGTSIAPDDSWIGRVVDPLGQSLDGQPILQGTQMRALKGEVPNPTTRRPLGARLETGMTVFNTFLPIVSGQRIGLFAGSGVGKSTLLAKLARGVHADVVVIALIGERGREVREFVERVLGEQGMKRAVVVAATSDQSPMMRRRCAWMAMSVAEHFRDLGRQVLFLADSITRFAEAHREIALASGENGTLRGYPPSTTQQITLLCERAGPGVGQTGDITAVLSVLVAGSDMEEPVADILRGVLDGHVVLDRKIAERGRFPAIDVLRSVSRALPEAAADAENALIMEGRQLLGLYDRSEMMIQAGLYSAGSDAMLDHAIESWSKIDGFLAEPEVVGTRASFERLADCLSTNTG
ncbi:FliI/YscN family ATPase [Aliiroseovarius sp. PrR006]|uniref:FliI/YscN family ATPase n=1 Tax=Aliiroseovarius sp. PrR006 TaxID=2706883 RepID=UPI0013D5D695|nr:FliI/YscN family ATPase [Aliiroseovarius sp. PrR006]NDW54581.1 FliI/YscN family ATPase [Aliiroseovarius sp. PrR006]